MKKSSAMLILLVAMFGLPSCKRQPREWVALGGPAVKADLLVVFQKDAPQKQINNFLSSYIVEGDVNKSFRSRPEIQSIMATSIGPYDNDGYVIVLKSSVTTEQRRELKARLEKSPVVCKVFENTAPNEVRLP